MEDFEEWLSESFTTLQIDPVFTEYISGILQDEEISLSDRIETVLQVLSSATEEVRSFFYLEKEKKFKKK